MWWMITWVVIISAWCIGYAIGRRMGPQINAVNADNWARLWFEIGFLLALGQVDVGKAEE